MKPGGGKEKGSQFERDCCRELSEWVSDGNRNDLFWRSAGSGSVATISLKGDVKEHNQAGDISYIHHAGRILLDNYVVECKYYNELNLENIALARPSGNFYQFWKELSQLSIQVKRYPFLIAKQNYKPTIVATNSEGFRLLEKWIDEARIPPDKFHKPFLLSIVYHMGIYILDYETLLDTTQPFWEKGEGNAK